MKKEVTFSILVGFGIGILITFGLYTYNKKNSTVVFESPAVLETPALEEETPSKTANNVQNISLVSPLDQSIIKEPKTTITGVTTPNSTVVIIWELGEKVLQSDTKGNFETEILLDSGENQIEIQSYSENGDKASKTITVVYSTAEI